MMWQIVAFKYIFNEKYSITMRHKLCRAFALDALASRLLCLFGSCRVPKVKLFESTPPPPTPHPSCYMYKYTAHSMKLRQTALKLGCVTKRNPTVQGGKCIITADWLSLLNIKRSVRLYIKRLFIRDHAMNQTKIDFSQSSSTIKLDPVSWCLVCCKSVDSLHILIKKKHY